MNFKSFLIGFIIGGFLFFVLTVYTNKKQVQKAFLKGYDSGIGYTLDTCVTILQKTLENTRKDSCAATRLIINDTNIYILSKKTLCK